MLIDKLAYPDLKRAVVEQRALFDRSVILIEDKASGTQLIQELIEGGLSMVTRCKPDGDKIMRLHAQTATIENGFVHLPREACWLGDYVHELIIFPAGRFDDQVELNLAGARLGEAEAAGLGHLRIYPARGRARGGPRRAAAGPIEGAARRQ